MLHRLVACGVLALSCFGAAAQAPQRPNPADPGAAVPPLRYQPAFADYRPFEEQKIAPWREVNDEVGKAGGGHGGGHDMGGMNMSKPPAAPSTASKPAPANRMEMNVRKPGAHMQH